METSPMSSQYFDDDKEGPKDECGVFGIYAPGLDVARITFFALVALQHRGQESAGIASLERKETIHLRTGMGLVSQIFAEEDLRYLKGNLAAIGHTRYSTAGGSKLLNAQPVVMETSHGQMALAQNGNLTKAKSLRKSLLQSGVGLFMESDLELILQMIAANPVNNFKNHGQAPSSPAASSSSSSCSHATAANWEARIQSFMAACEGAYSLTILTRDALFAVRDYLGMRPLCIGEIPIDETKKGYLVASETCAIDIIGGKYIREVAPGEIIRIDENGFTSFQGRPPAPSPALCVFEYVYLARPDSIIEGQLVHQVREELGRQLAREAPADADIIVGVPDSSLPAAIGYSIQSRIPYGSGLIKNRYVHRTFIHPDNHLRKLGISMKFNTMPAVLKGKRVVLIDDSIVRGNTITALIKMFRSAGAKEVHVRVSSPPVKHPCFMGIDMSTHEQLVAYNKTVEDIRKETGADSLAYLSLEGMMKAVNMGLPSDSTTHPHVNTTSNNNTPSSSSTTAPSPSSSSITAGVAPASSQSVSGSPTRHCSACFTGNYPLELDSNLDW